MAALRVAVVEAAEELAARSRELPNLHSHYGSRSIVLMTILQSWSQGAKVWGESGMRKLWSASNDKVVGDFDAQTSSVS